VAFAAVDALGLQNGIAFPQLIADEHGAVYAVEVAARIPAGQIADLASFAIGVNLFDVAIAQALGERVDDATIASKLERPIVIRFLTASPGSLPAGTIREIGGLDEMRRSPGVLAVDIYFGLGETIRPCKSTPTAAATSSQPARPPLPHWLPPTPRRRSSWSRSTEARRLSPAPLGSTCDEEGCARKHVSAFGTTTQPQAARRRSCQPVVTTLLTCVGGLSGHRHSASRSASPATSFRSSADHRVRTHWALTSNKCPNRPESRPIRPYSPPGSGGPRGSVLAQANEKRPAGRSAGRFLLIRGLLVRVQPGELSNHDSIATRSSRR
jgi:hypothetical protein